MRRPSPSSLSLFRRACTAATLLTAAFVALHLLPPPPPAAGGAAELGDRRLLVHVSPPPADDPHPIDCSPAPETSVPTMVASIFRCHLIEAGYEPARVRTIAAEAVAVAECESHFDPEAVIFDGRYRDVAHPVTGDRYSGAGVFQFIRRTADLWIEGGYANVTDPVANIDAAARIYISNEARGFPGWSDWACAAANDGFRSRSVLPGWPGGPDQLPAWTFEH
jgi:hypothetical protein